VQGDPHCGDWFHPPAADRDDVCVGVDLLSDCPDAAVHPNETGPDKLFRTAA
jgi:hypothetical protein